MDPREESAAFFEPRQRFFFCKKEAKKTHICGRLWHQPGRSPPLAKVFAAAR
jgi:hypothetical protein